MAAVSPWFFTVRLTRRDPAIATYASFHFIFFLLHFQHYGPNSWNKNVRQCRILICTALYFLQWIYRGDDWLLVRRWEYLLAQRSAIDIVQVISWNGKVFFLC